MNNDTTNLITTTEACPIASFLVQLGNVLLKEEKQEWLDMDKLSELCKAHKIQLNGDYPGSDELESALRKLFGNKDELFAEGVNVVGYDRKIGWEFAFMVRFYKYNPNWKVTPLSSFNTYTEDLHAPGPLSESTVQEEVPCE